MSSNTEKPLRRERMAATAAATTKFELYILTRKRDKQVQKKPQKLLNYAPSNKIFTTTPSSSAPLSLFFCRTKSKPTFNLETIDYQQFLLIYFFFSFSFIRFIYFAYNNSKVFIKIYYPNQTNDRKTPNS
ncbi:hypothetical protein MG5_01199 [Candida albicans P57072]|uniref:Uncharacterized protein n=1 Tax=Candida albicans (strain WO-1) TaxID=294748 RepID=C4YG78_CANAW|nr:conserved hypothetical protein [Candida albicans WO-1]KGQ90889.1 hypothetical protein MEO_01207 [Candida albicans P94015]KGR02964.1 hypothetical protein MG1_01210 [Candida albicans GC75]KGR14460.1 hypothetical protein MG5_01199 [Candida albicans P57072]KGU13475.1 hypothetical protein MEQ_01195 [Candida albicans P87]KGU31638.1 hypothetical protein MG7_01203 [Candida albicans P34048]KGU34597.1 hypothetical protein MGM_01254 [Candida albicans P75063]KGU37022.1 hypothetical protein MGK_01197 